MDSNYQTEDAECPLFGHSSDVRIEKAINFTSQTAKLVCLLDKAVRIKYSLGEETQKERSCVSVLFEAIESTGDKVRGNLSERTTFDADRGLPTTGDIFNYFEDLIKYRIKNELSRLSPIKQRNHEVTLQELRQELITSLSQSSFDSNLLKNRRNYFIRDLENCAEDLRLLAEKC